MADGDSEAPPGASEYPPSRRSRRSRLYDEGTGKLDVKRIAAWVGGAAALLAAAGALGSQAEGFVKWWLEIDTLEESVTDCHSRIDSVDEELRPADPPPDPNLRLDTALPIISDSLREHRADIRGLRMATTKLSTIHEYGLDGMQARTAAREAAAAVDVDAEAAPVAARPPVRPDGARVRRPAGGGAGVADRGTGADDPLGALDGL